MSLIEFAFIVTRIPIKRRKKYQQYLLRWTHLLIINKTHWNIYLITLSHMKIVDWRLETNTISVWGCNKVERNILGICVFVRFDRNSHNFTHMQTHTGPCTLHYTPQSKPNAAAKKIYAKYSPILQLNYVCKFIFVNHKKKHTHNSTWHTHLGDK